MTVAPTPEVRLYVELIGEDATILLIEHHGGTLMTIPQTASSKLAQEIGAAAVAALSDHFGAERVRIPLSKAWRARVYRQRGMSFAAIARKLGCGERVVYEYVTGSSRDRQLQLKFDKHVP